jgi:NitT/TauT family transport system permease protein
MSSVPAESGAKDAAVLQSGGGTASASTRDRSGRLLRLVLPAVTLVVVVVAAWQAGLVHKLLGLEPYTLAYPSDIVDTLRTEPGTLLPETSTTLLAAASGFAIGSATGFVLAILLAELDLLRRTLLPMLSGLVSMPIIALAPLMVLYFGLGIASKIAVAAIMTAAPMAVTAYKGLNSYDGDSADLLRSYAASRWRFWLDLKLPTSLPYVFTALMGILWYQLVGGVERLIVPWDQSLRGKGD